MENIKSLAVSIQNVRKEYAGISVLKGLSLEIRQGECFGLLGPNGAGKSTLMKMIYGHVIPTSGELYVMGLNTQFQISEIKKKMGVVPQEDGLDTDFSSLENLLLYSNYFRIAKDIALSRSEFLLSEMKLLEQKHQHVETLSGGMKRRLAIARALLNNPQLLILDEPTTGLDPQARLWICNYFEKLKLQKTTILITTHYMEEAEKLCDRIAIVDHGQILDIGTSAELVQKHIGQEVVEITVGNEKNYWISQVQGKNLEFQDYENKLFIFFKTSEERQSFIQNIQNTHYLVRAANLNDVFLKLAGYQIRGEG